MATLQFKGKSAVWNHHLSVPYHTLEKDAKKSLKGMDAEENLIKDPDDADQEPRHTYDIRIPGIFRLYMLPRIL